MYPPLFTGDFEIGKALTKLEKESIGFRVIKPTNTVFSCFTVDNQVLRRIIEYYK